MKIWTTTLLAATLLALAFELAYEVIVNLEASRGIEEDEVGA